MIFVPNNQRACIIDVRELPVYVQMAIGAIDQEVQRQSYIVYTR